MPKPIRGALLLIQAFVLTLFGTIFNLQAGRIYDLYENYSPYTMTAGWDLAFASFALVLGISGKLSVANPQDA